MNDEKRIWRKFPTYTSDIRILSANPCVESSYVYNKFLKIIKQQKKSNFILPNHLFEI